MDHLDLLFRLSYLSCFEGFQIANILLLEVFHGDIVAGIEAMLHSCEFVIRRNSEGL